MTFKKCRETHTQWGEPLSAEGRAILGTPSVCFWHLPLKIMLNIVV